ncbi:MAG: beta-ketoacyl-[acyl-carrier-protein] synthase family protein [bacterium]|nr:beta-ketoacyl-[acyl-carrier-protein] synthase family protein [bacterium]MXV90037.1 beta-ketoacyl-[acyl-carrier-protein] synthase family protein [Acidimicrobiia bacterium]MYC46533.1 beta-ketoacyl-[acyl-carrier-protein] synthase family protein [Acidimicrobiia bacterium]MYI19202.1 beta-ketoacyl-[acyl-carrier-protein] synthase family protein [Acidimicrobiia bacterium]
MSRRRVVVTGLGVLAACGIGQEDFFAGLLSEPPKGLRAVAGFDPAPHFANAKEMRRHDRFTQFALACAAEALEQAGDLEPDPDRVGVWIGTGVGGLMSIETCMLAHFVKGPKRVSPFLIPMMMANAAAAAVSMRYGYQGPCESTSTACASATQSIGNAAELIRHGRCDVMLAGGSECSSSPTGLQGFANMTALSRVGISRPFDLERDGFMHAEGCGVLVLEELEHARARGAEAIAEIAGYASTADAYHITAPSPGGAGAVACMERALDDAGLAPSDIVHINAHGTSTPLNDASEAEAIHKVFGSPGPLVTSTKGVTGHALGAAGAIEAAAVVMSIQRGVLPPTACYETPDPDMAPIRILAPDPCEWEPGPSISNSFGFGGHNGCLVISPPPAA